MFVRTNSFSPYELKRQVIEDMEFIQQQGYPVVQLFVYTMGSWQEIKQ